MPIVLARGLQDSVAGSHIVHQEIAVWVKGDGAERGGNRKRAAIDLCSRWSGGYCFDVADRTTDFAEQAEAPFCVRAVGELRIARRRLGSANEAGEVVSVGKAVRPRCVIGLRGDVAEIG